MMIGMAGNAEVLKTNSRGPNVYACNVCALGFDLGAAD